MNNKIIQTINGPINFNLNGLLKGKPITSIKEETMRDGLKKLFCERSVPSFAQGSLSSDEDEELIDKKEPKGPHILQVDDDTKQNAYDRPVGSLLPIGISQKNDVDGALHFNGEMYKANQNDIDDKNVNDMLKQFVEKGGKVEDDTADQLKSGYTKFFNDMVKKDKYSAQQSVIDNMLKDPQYYGKDDASQIYDQPNKKEKEKEENDSVDTDDYDWNKEDNSENNPDKWWPGHSPVGKEIEDEFENDLEKIDEDLNGTSDYTNPTSQHGDGTDENPGVMKAVNVGENNTESDEPSQPRVCSWCNYNILPHGDRGDVRAKYDPNATHGMCMTCSDNWKKQVSSRNQQPEYAGVVEDMEEMNEILFKLNVYRERRDAGVPFFQPELTEELNEEYKLIKKYESVDDIQNKKSPNDSNKKKNIKNSDNEEKPTINIDKKSSPEEEKQKVKVYDFDDPKSWEIDYVPQTIEENEHWEKFRKELAGKSREERQEMMKRYITSKSPVGSKHSEIQDLQTGKKYFTRKGIEKINPETGEKTYEKPPESGDELVEQHFQKFVSTMQRSKLF